MRKITVIIIFLFSSLVINAQYYDDGPVLSFSGDLAIPMTKIISDRNYPGIGGTLKLAIPVNDFGDIVLAGSLMSFLGKNYEVLNKTKRYKSRNILVAMAGYRQYLSSLAEQNTWYLEPRGGLTFDGTKYRKLTYGVALGYLINNRFDLSARYQGNDRFSFFGLSLGYGIPL